MPDMHPWDVEVRFSDAAMARVLRAVVECGGQITCTYLARYAGCAKHSWPLQLRVKLPAGTEEAFRMVSGFDLHEPPEVVGLAGHGT